MVRGIFPSWPQRGSPGGNEISVDNEIESGYGSSCFKHVEKPFHTEKSLCQMNPRDVAGGNHDSDSSLPAGPP
jgi:hypothetical protein